MTCAGFAELFADGAPAAPAPPPDVHPWPRKMPLQTPYSSREITDPEPHGRRMSVFKLATGTDFRPILH